MAIHYHTNPPCDNNASCEEIFGPGQHGSDTAAGSGWWRCEHPDEEPPGGPEGLHSGEGASLHTAAPADPAIAQATGTRDDAIDLGSVRLEDGIRIALRAEGEGPAQGMFLRLDKSGALTLGTGRNNNPRTIWNENSTEYHFTVKVVDSQEGTILLKAVNGGFLTIQDKAASSRRVTASAEEAEAGSGSKPGVFRVRRFRDSVWKRPVIALSGGLGRYLAPDANGQHLTDEATDLKDGAWFMVGVVGVPDTLRIGA